MTIQGLFPLGLTGLIPLLSRGLLRVFSSITVQKHQFFVNDKVSIVVWIYLWVFYFVPLIYIFVFVPVPYCLDDCAFVVEPEVRQVDSSSSFFFLRIALAIQGFLYFHTNCEIICSSSMKNTASSLIGIALNL